MPAPAAAQNGPLHGRFGVVEDDVRAKLRADWEQQTTQSSERAYCGLYTREATTLGFTAYRVYAALDAMQAPVGNDPYTSNFFCPKQANVILIHTHTPTSCSRVNGALDLSTCHWGGYDAWQCEASTLDMETLVRSGKPFGVLQCDRNALVFYYPPDVPADSLGRPTHRALFVTALAGGAWVLGHADRDPGGYTDAWTTRSTFPDKAVHAGAAWLLTSAGTDLGLKPWQSALVVTAAGAAFERAQGHVSRYDIGADALGALGAALWRSWRR
jgi:hypothetical protein